MSYSPPTFLSLPTEIRLKIYRQLRTSEDRFDSNFPFGSLAFNKCDFHYNTEILQVNKQIYTEAFDVFSHENTWNLSVSYWRAYQTFVTPYDWSSLPLHPGFRSIHSIHIELQLSEIFMFQTDPTYGPISEALLIHLYRAFKVFSKAPALHSIGLSWHKEARDFTWYSKCVELHWEQTQETIIALAQLFSALPPCYSPRNEKEVFTEEATNIPDPNISAVLKAEFAKSVMEVMRDRECHLSELTAKYGESVCSHSWISGVRREGLRILTGWFK
ncbi:hypothetical protein MMC12_006175 [Toensbergia leucococca]|nr:hypothetical protein [Toensbergia leucococca]